jgi:hypothetical protein
LLVDFGELERYEELVQVETRKKWEQGMKEDMDFLVHNQTIMKIEHIKKPI